MGTEKSASRGSNVSTYLSGEDLDILEAMAKDKGKTRSNLIHEFILEGIKKEGDGRKEEVRYMEDGKVKRILRRKQ